MQLLQCTDCSFCGNPFRRQLISRPRRLLTTSGGRQQRTHPRTTVLMSRLAMHPLACPSLFGRQSVSRSDLSHNGQPGRRKQTQRPEAAKKGGGKAVRSAAVAISLQCLPNLWPSAQNLTQMITAGVTATD